MVGAKVPNERGVFVFYMICSLPFLPEKVLRWPLLIPRNVLLLLYRMDRYAWERLWSPFWWRNSGNLRKDVFRWILLVLGLVNVHVSYHEATVIYFHSWIIKPHIWFVFDLHLDPRLTNVLYKISSPMLFTTSTIYFVMISAISVTCLCLSAREKVTGFAEFFSSQHIISNTWLTHLVLI